MHAHLYHIGLNKYATTVWLCLATAPEGPDFLVARSRPAGIPCGRSSTLGGWGAANLEAHGLDEQQ